MTGVRTYVNLLSGTINSATIYLSVLVADEDVFVDYLTTLFQTEET